MRPALTRILLGVLIAVVGVTLASVPTIGGIATWKVVLGVIGVVLFLLAGFDRKR